MIIAVKTRRELKKNSNILLTNLALADLLVGAVSMPLTIALDALVIQRLLVVDIICTINFISASVMYTICGASILHLLLIAWERYVAVAKWMEYKAIVTRDRVNKYTRVAWLWTVPMVVPLVILVASSVRYEIVLVVNVIVSIFWFICLSLIAYLYVTDISCSAKMEPNANPPSKCSSPREGSKQDCFDDFLVNSVCWCRWSSDSCRLFLPRRFTFLTPNFNCTMGRNNTSV